MKTFCSIINLISLSMCMSAQAELASGIYRSQSLQVSELRLSAWPDGQFAVSGCVNEWSDCSPFQVLLSVSGGAHAGIGTITKTGYYRVGRYYSRYYANECQVPFSLTLQESVVEGQRRVYARYWAAPVTDFATCEYAEAQESVVADAFRVCGAECSPRFDYSRH